MIQTTPIPSNLAPEVLAEDPAPGAPRGLRRAVGLLVQHLLFLLVTPALALWPLYGLLRLFFPRPPHVAPPARFARVARLIASAGHLDVVERWWMLAHLARTALLAPSGGVAWIVDEIIHRRALAAHPLEDPLFEISAWRSGSTRLAHLLEDDSRLAAPTLLQAFFPYLWLWRLARLVLKGRVSTDAVSRMARSKFPPEFALRHEIDPFRTDTYDVRFFVYQLVHYTMTLGPDALLAEFSHRGVTPSTRQMWEEDFVRMVDGLGRRTLAFAGPAPGGGRRRFFLKGHFLAAAPALAQRWPKAAFVTIVRDPGARLQSTLNYLRSMPNFFGLGPTPWSSIVQVVPAEIEYNHSERDWYTRDDGVRRCVVTFDEFVSDLPSALGRIYRTCLDAEGPPPEVQVEHAPRDRRYLIDHSIEALGVDRAAFDDEMVAYRAWCEWQGPSR